MIDGIFLAFGLMFTTRLMFNEQVMIDIGEEGIEKFGLIDGYGWHRAGSKIHHPLFPQL